MTERIADPALITVFHYRPQFCIDNYIGLIDPRDYNSLPSFFSKACQIICSTQFIEDINSFTFEEKIEHLFNVMAYSLEPRFTNEHPDLAKALIYDALCQCEEMKVHNS